MQDELISLQIQLMEQERLTDDLNKEVLRLAQRLERLEKEYNNLKSSMQDSLVKPQSEETPPPHY